MAHYITGLPDDSTDPQVTYVTKATFDHLWEKFKSSEEALDQAGRINGLLADNAIRLGDEVREYAKQVQALRLEMTRVMEDLDKANEFIARCVCK